MVRRYDFEVISLSKLVVINQPRIGVLPEEAFAFKNSALCFDGFQVGARPALSMEGARQNANLSWYSSLCKNKSWAGHRYER